MNRALEVSLLLTLPAAAALVAVPDPIVTVLFQRGAFGAEAAAATTTGVLVSSRAQKPGESALIST